jgi:hypothetical protein
MWVKRDRRRHCSDRFRPLYDRLHYPLMPEMKPVKNPKRQNGRPQNGRILGSVKDLHRSNEDSILGGGLWQTCPAE